MQRLEVRPSRLEGEVTVSGAKNSVLRLLAASLLTDETITLHNYPAGLLDAQLHVEMLQLLGKRCELIGGQTMSVMGSGSLASELQWQGRSIRNTLLILGALTARTGMAAVPLPGGCNLGERAFDLHEMVLRGLGAEVWQEDGLLRTSAPRGLTGADLHLPIRSTGATENAIISACLAKGVSRIWNPHIRPEILDLVTFLNGMGASIKVFGQEHIEVNGVEGLRGVSHAVMADNMEAITWLVAAVMTGGDVEIRHFPAADVEVALVHLRESGARFYRGDDSLLVCNGRCYPVEISTGPHPGINSDVQPILAAFAACARGESRIIDLRFPGRYGYAAEMARLGLDYEVEGNLLKIFGYGGRLHGAAVKALDLRAGVALALCGLVAEGETRIDDAWQISRGYDDFVGKLQTLGGDVRAS